MQKTQELQVPFMGQEDPLEEEVATHSSILAWKIPWTEEPGGLQSMRSQKVRQLNAHVHTHTHVKNQLAYCKRELLLSSIEFFCIPFSSWNAQTPSSSSPSLSWNFRNLVTKSKSVPLFIPSTNLVLHSRHKVLWGTLVKPTQSLSCNK